MKKELKMNRQDTEHSVKILKLLEYIQCRPISEAFGKIHFWDFIIDLANGYEKYGSLTDKQYEALQRLIAKHTGCTTVDKEVIVHKVQYESTGSIASNHRNKVEHDYGQLQIIQLFDLPFNNGEFVTMTVQPYNEYSMVIEHNGVMYKIPKPVGLDEILEVTTIVAKYRRTECKGYLDDIAIRKVDNNKHTIL